MNGKESKTDDAMVTWSSHKNAEQSCRSDCHTPRHHGGGGRAVVATREGWIVDGLADAVHTLCVVKLSSTSHFFELKTTGAEQTTRQTRAEREQGMLRNS